MFTPDELLSVFPNVADLPNCYKAKLDYVRCINESSKRLCVEIDNDIICRYYDRVQFDLNLKVFLRRFI